MARRIKSLHHNLGEKNVVFHREHRSKKNRRNLSRFQKLLVVAFKKQKEKLQQQALDDEAKNSFKG